MQTPERFSDLPEYAFPRLRALLDPFEPGGEPIAMSIGEPRHPFPDFVGEVLARHVADYGRYPPNEGLPGLRFVHLAGSAALIGDRLAARRHRYMPAALLASQFATLEPPADALTLDVAEPVDALVEAVVARLLTTDEEPGEP